MSESATKQANCFGCGDEIDVQADEWWSHSWEEHPAEETIDKAIEADDFRDWFRENKVFCSSCHKDVIGKLLYIREANDLPSYSCSDGIGGD